MLLYNFVFEYHRKLPSKNLTDDDILKIAKRVPYNNFIGIGVELGFSLTEVTNIEQKHNKDIERASQELLMTWKNEHGSGSEQKVELRSILVSGGLKDLTDVLGPAPFEKPTLTSTFPRR